MFEICLARTCRCVGFFSPSSSCLALIVVAALAGAPLRRRTLGAATARGRQPRLAVIDAAAVDGRRRLVLIRRDNVEHLVMIGGPTDVVIEPNIVRAVPRRRDAAPRHGPGDERCAVAAVPLGDAGMGRCSRSPHRFRVRRVCPLRRGAGAMAGRARIAAAAAAAPAPIATRSARRAGG